MRVLLVNAHGADPNGGGAERRIRYLLDGLTARGNYVELLSAFPQSRDPGVNSHVLHDTDWRDDEARRVRNHVGDVAAIPWSRLQRIIVAANYDVVHTHNLPGIGTGVWEAARRAGVPVVHSLLDYYLLCPRTTLLRRDGTPCEPHPLLCGARTRRLARWSDSVGTVLGTSQYVLDRHRGLFAPDAAEAKMPPPLKPLDGTKRPPVAGPPRVLGYMGFLTTEKGGELLLETAPALAARGLTLRVAGDGPLRERFEAAEHVEYLGQLGGPELAAFVDSCDLGVVPSLWEEPGGGPFVLGEWLGAGRPVLTTRRGGLAEAEDLGGLLTFEESPQALIATLDRLTDPEEWQLLVATVPAIDGEAELERWLDRHESIYEGTRAQRPASILV